MLPAMPVGQADQADPAMPVGQAGPAMPVLQADPMQVDLHPDRPELAMPALQADQPLAANDLGQCQELTLVSGRRRLCKRRRRLSQPYCRQHSKTFIFSFGFISEI
ncbi:uncharacterized protein LOC106011773 [Aplysia californica]|uniref:Uncharacterized protein LOC106011773 n=1 Tax=Aplysia californica TaxID=6500 RepID=A0ABM0ZZX0_APLCA|nr:uncharacterized protein LOC106011773 [Aplysia californica]